MIGERLKLLRTKKGTKQKELGNILGVSESIVSLYETNRSDPKDKNKVEIAKYFGVSLDYLLGIIDDEVPYYCKEKFIILPEGITPDEKVLVEEFIDSLKIRRADNERLN